MKKKEVSNINFILLMNGDFKIVHWYNNNWSELILKKFNIGHLFYSINSINGTRRLGALPRPLQNLSNVENSKKFLVYNIANKNTKKE